MNKRTSHGMIFVPLLCLLAALLGCIMFARARENAVQPIASESVSEAVGIFQSPVLDMPEALASALIFDPLPSDEPVNTPPPVEDWVCPLTDEEVELIALLKIGRASCRERV